MLRLIPEGTAHMVVLLRLMLQISLGIALAVGVVSVQRSPADEPRPQPVRAEASCQPLNDGLWRGGTVQLTPRPHLMHVSLTRPNMMVIMNRCASVKRT